MVDVFAKQVELNLEPNATRQFRAVIADAYSFIRSAEANQAIATVTLEQLIGDVINKNGESGDSNAEQFNPYVYDAEEKAPAGTKPEERANFLGGTDTGAPSRLDRILAIQQELSDTIRTIKEASVTQVADADEYTDKSKIGLE